MKVALYLALGSLAASLVPDIVRETTGTKKLALPKLSGHACLLLKLVICR